MTDILAERIGQLGVITLNRPKALNALNQTIIDGMYQALSTWQREDAVKAVVVQAAQGRAFCAGGDLRSAYEYMLHPGHDPSQFFRTEYQLNKLIYHYPKPYIALLDGITMGGGVGISIHGSHRVATENLLFAMPETGIGLYPDVGGTYFLPRVRQHLGFYLALTGARIQVADAKALDLVDAHVASADLPALIQQLATTPFSADAKQSVTAIIQAFQQETAASALLAEQEALSDCFYQETMEAIVQKLQTSSNPLCLAALEALATKSPTSLKVTLNALHIGSQLTFDACMQQEFRLTSHFLTSHDFREGIRALIIDKDQAPIWQPATLQAVAQTDVAHYFAPVERELETN